MNIASLIAILFYLAATALLATKFHPAVRGSNRAGTVAFSFRISGFAALSLHAGLLYTFIVPGNGFDFGFFNAISMISWLVALIVMVTSLFRPLENLLLVLFPIAVTAILLEIFIPDKHLLTASPSTALGIHILLSICAYSLLMISALQALALGMQDKMLKARLAIKVINILPPLQVMENLLIQFIFIGFFLLSLSLLSGFMFVHDLFAQHLVHKTVFSIIAWIIYCVLLWGRWTFGWRGRKVVRWALGGFISLLLAYTGSKFVLELILQRV